MCSECSSLVAIVAPALRLLCYARLMIQLWAWLTMAMGSEESEAADECEIEDHRFIKLMPNGKVRWGQQVRECGDWEYVYDEQRDRGAMKVCFKSREHVQVKRHWLDQTGKNSFILRKPGHPIYQMEDIWPPDTYVHCNKAPVRMTRVTAALT